MYEKIGDDIYNLSFGDWIEGESRGNDKIRSNNNDHNKVILTVAFTVLEFTKYHPDAIILAKGSTPSRTRLYQMGIAANLNIVRESFTVLGYADGKWHVFMTGMNYTGFSLKAK